VTIGATFIAENLLTLSQEKGLPWDLATNFDNAAPIGTFIPLYKKQTSDPESTKQFKPLPDNISFKLTINNELLFTATSGQVNHHIDKIIALISQYYTLRQGDIIYMGSPIPSQIVNINDKIEGYLNNELVLKFNVK
jgi:2-keto-4-pentenoate hydratase/2-oxohepta-3-ene-1,7-dioic acid hydratase in catechol pathway